MMEEDTDDDEKNDTRFNFLFFLLSCNFGGNYQRDYNGSEQSNIAAILKPKINLLLIQC
jgi:hypothetical protein